MDNQNDKNEKTEESKNSFITEKIKPKTRRKIRKVLEVCGLALLAAVIVGFVGRVIFEASGGIVDDVLGKEEKPVEKTEEPSRTEVVLSTGHGPGDVYVAKSVGISGEADDKEEDKPSPTAVPSPEPEVTQAEPTGEDIPVKDVPSVEGPDGPSVTPVELVTSTPSVEVKEEVPEEEEITPLDEYISIVGDMQKLDREVSSCVVTVRACNSGINWLDENIETYNDVTGVIVGENGVEMLIMSSYSDIENADRIEVILSDGYTMDGEIYLADEVYNLAVVSVKLSAITAKEKNALRCVCIGDSDTISRGDAIMAIGMPDGYTGSVEYGFISAVGRTSYIQDGLLKVFATSLTYHQKSDAVIINMAGELVGIISHNIEQDEDDRITTCVEINSVKDVLIGLLNGKSTPKLGIRAEDMPADVLEGMNLNNGIYINEVITGTPAADAGLRKGDVITRIGDTSIKNIGDLMGYLVGANVGDETSIEYFRSSQRDESKQVITLTLN